MEEDQEQLKGWEESPIPFLEQYQLNKKRVIDSHTLPKNERSHKEKRQKPSNALPLIKKINDSSKYSAENKVSTKLQSSFKILAETDPKIVENSQERKIQEIHQHMIAVAAAKWQEKSQKTGICSPKTQLKQKVKSYKNKAQKIKKIESPDLKDIEEGFKEINLSPCRKSRQSSPMLSRIAMKPSKVQKSRCFHVRKQSTEPSIQHHKEMMVIPINKKNSEKSMSKILAEGYRNVMVSSYERNKTLNRKINHQKRKTQITNKSKQFDSELGERNSLIFSHFATSLEVISHSQGLKTLCKWNKVLKEVQDISKDLAVAFREPKNHSKKSKKHTLSEVESLNYKHNKSIKNLAKLQKVGAGKHSNSGKMIQNNENMGAPSKMTFDEFNDEGIYRS